MGINLGQFLHTMLGDVSKGAAAVGHTVEGAVHPQQAASHPDPARPQRAVQQVQPMQTVRPPKQTPAQI